MLDPKMIPENSCPTTSEKPNQVPTFHRKIVTMTNNMINRYSIISPKFKKLQEMLVPRLTILEAYAQPLKLN